MEMETYDYTYFKLLISTAGLRRNRFIEMDPLNSSKLCRLKPCSPVPGQKCAGWSKTGSARLRCWCTTVQRSSSWSFQIQRCPGFPRSCRSLRYFKGEKKGTNTLILLCNGTSKSPAAVSIDKTLMMIRVQPKYGVDPNRAAVWWETVNSSLQKRRESLNGFYWFNLQSFSISLQTMHISEKRRSSHYQPVSHAQCSEFLLFTCCHYAWA